MTTRCSETEPAGAALPLPNDSGEQPRGPTPRALDAAMAAGGGAAAASSAHDPPALIKSVLTASATAPGNEGYRLADDAMLVVVHDGSGRIIDLSGNVSAVTESGAAMLELALRHGTSFACRTLAARYRIGEDVIRADLETLFRSLEGQRVLVPATAATGNRSLRRALSFMLYPLVLACAARPLRWTPTRAWLLISWAFLATRAFGWTNTTRIWARAAARLNAARAADALDRAAVATIDTAVASAIARHPLPMSCKERALTAWVLARAAGVPARMQLGIELFPFGLHCWCEHESQIIADRYEGRCDRYTPILTYG
jgi:hypothetical protein